MSSMIVAPQPIAVEAGAKVLMAGGNAIDAAVTCAFVQSVVTRPVARPSRALDTRRLRLGCAGAGGLAGFARDVGRDGHSP